MVKEMQVLAIIPARGGSKGIPRKNIKLFAGFPLIAYSIVAALQSKFVNRVIVSTDDQEIADIAMEWGAEVPFMRPAIYSQDDTPDFPVIKHVLDQLKKTEGYAPDYVVQLRPTSPIRPRNCIDTAVQLMIDSPGGDCVRGVVEAGQNPYKMWKLGAQSDYMIPLLAYESINEPYNAPRQLLPRVYWQTGHIDVIRTKTILEKGSLTGENVLPLIIDSRFAVDIDSPSDWEASERLVYTENLSIIDPAEKRRQFPKGISLLAMDFDGVLTDDRVIVDQNGKESVIANRSDGLGLEKLRKKTNIRFVVISKEVNPVVAMRCQKLNIPFIQSIEHKAEALHQFITDNQIESNTVIFIGNDTNDLSVLKEVGFFVAPKNAHPEVLRKADLILSRSGGYGAIRELCDMILAQLGIS